MVTYISVLRGSKFRPMEAQAVVARLETDEAVELEREPDNPYDENAIKVIAHGEHIGYVAKEDAVEIASIMDNHTTVNCLISDAAGSKSPFLEINTRAEDDAAVEPSTA